MTAVVEWASAMQCAGADGMVAHDASLASPGWGSESARPVEVAACTDDSSFSFVRSNSPSFADMAGVGITSIGGEVWRRSGQGQSLGVESNSTRGHVDGEDGRPGPHPASVIERNALLSGSGRAVDVVMADAADLAGSNMPQRTGSLRPPTEAFVGDEVSAVLPGRERPDVIDSLAALVDILMHDATETEYETSTGRQPGLEARWPQHLRAAYEGAPGHAGRVAGDPATSAASDAPFNLGLPARQERSRSRSRDSSPAAQGTAASGADEGGFGRTGGGGLLPDGAAGEQFLSSRALMRKFSPGPEKVALSAAREGQQRRWSSAQERSSTRQGALQAGASGAGGSAPSTPSGCLRLAEAAGEDSSAGTASLADARRAPGDGPSGTVPAGARALEDVSSARAVAGPGKPLWRKGQGPPIPARLAAARGKVVQLDSRVKFVDWNGMNNNVKAGRQPNRKVPAANTVAPKAVSAAVKPPRSPGSFPPPVVNDLSRSQSSPLVIGRQQDGTPQDESASLERAKSSEPALMRSESSFPWHPVGTLGSETAGTMPRFGPADSTAALQAREGSWAPGGQGLRLSAAGHGLSPIIIPSSPREQLSSGGLTPVTPVEPMLSGGGAPEGGPTAEPSVARSASFPACEGKMPCKHALRSPGGCPCTLAKDGTVSAEGRDGGSGTGERSACSGASDTAGKAARVQGQKLVTRVSPSRSALKSPGIAPQVSPRSSLKSPGPAPHMVSPKQVRFCNVVEVFRPGTSQEGACSHGPS